MKRGVIEKIDKEEEEKNARIYYTIFSTLVHLGTFFFMIDILVLLCSLILSDEITVFFIFDFHAIHYPVIRLIAYKKRKRKHER
jgi:hypothetical protein